MTLPASGPAKRVVWILGAGFSAPLGGPLLPQLLSPASHGGLVHRYPSAALDSPATNAVVELFAYGSNYERGRMALQGGSGLKVWRDAEDFLEFLDAAAGDDAGPEAKRLRMLLTYAGCASHDEMTPSALQLAARRLVAAECSAFVDTEKVTTERWSPFVAWARSLRETDTVVTFNYDCVLETIDPRFLNPVLPNGDGQIPTVGALLKLHGSVDWKRTEESGKGYLVRKDAATFAVTATDAESMCFATPGPSKRAMSAGFQRLWSMAEKALHKADAVIFVGYRFPPSDADSRRRLLHAIEQNDRPTLSAHLVLGPPRADSDAPRVSALVRYMLRRAGRNEVPPHAPVGRPQHPGITMQLPMSPEFRGFSVTEHPLWTEDFLTVLDRSLL